MRLRPFFSFYGSKWSLAPHYDPPKSERVIECFAGSAGYATLHDSKEVLLVDIDPNICQLWEYLIGVTEGEILGLPLEFEHVDELTGVCEEAKLLLGFWINVATTFPCKTFSKWSRQQNATGVYFGCWGEKIRARVARQLARIRHWKVICSSYAELPDMEGTYFVDPPYQEMGHKYRFSHVDFEHLAEWCRARAAAGNQVIACEAEGATWLPFRALREKTKVDRKRVTGPNLRRYTEQVCYLPEAV